MRITFCNREFPSKPNRDDMYFLSKTTNNHSLDLSIREIAQNINHGKTFRPNIFDLTGDGNINGELFLGTEFLVLDIDNDNRDTGYISIEAMKDKLLNWDIQPCIIYPTFSSTPDHDKFRVIFHLSETINKDNQRKLDVLMQMLLSLFPESDRSCKDRNRMFHGTNKPLDSFYINETANLNEINLFQRFVENIEQINTNSTREWATIARRWGVALTQRNIPHILKDEEHKTIQPNFIYGLESNPMTYRSYRSQDVPATVIGGAIPSLDVERQDTIEIGEWEGRLLRISDMYKGFHDGTLILGYDERMFIFQNLMFIVGGAKRFKEILQQHIAKYEHDITYYLRQIAGWKKTLNYPQNLDTFDYRTKHSDWLSKSRYPNILTALKARTFIPEYIPSGMNRVSVGDGFELLKAKFDYALSANDRKIYGIRAGVGSGKTDLYVKYDYSQYRKVMIAVPTHALAKEVEQRMADSKQTDFVRLLRKPHIEDAAVREIHDKCLRSGLYYQAERIFRAYFTANPTQKYREYVQSIEKAENAKIVITTHSYASKLLSVRKYDLVIFDEDILAEYISVSSIKYSDLLRFFNSCDIAGITEVRESVLNQVKNSYDQRLAMNSIQERVFSKCYHLTGIPQLDERTLRANPQDISMLPNANIIDFIKSTAYCIDAKNSDTNGNNISFVTSKSFRYKCKVLVLSATLNKDCFTAFCNVICGGHKRAEFIEIPEFINKGRVYQDLTYTFSETDLVENFSDRVSHIKDIVPDWQNCPVLTFMKLEHEFRREGFMISASEYTPLHYGNLTGIDSLKGKNLIVVGKYSPPEEYYRLLSEALHFDTANATLTNRIITIGEHKTKLYTYAPDSAMASLHEYKACGELIQAVGRARTARTNSNVYVFADFPLSISDVTTFDGGMIKS